MTAVEIFWDPKVGKNPLSAVFLSLSQWYVWFWKGQTMTQALKWKNCRCSQELGWSIWVCEIDVPVWLSVQLGIGVPKTPSRSMTDETSRPAPAECSFGENHAWGQTCASYGGTLLNCDLPTRGCTAKSVPWQTENWTGHRAGKYADEDESYASFSDELC